MNEMALKRMYGEGEGEARGNPGQARFICEDDH